MAVTKEPHILILAAGQGKRMHSSLPKVLHPVLYRPMLHYVLDLAYQLPHRSVSVVVGHGEDQVRAACAGYDGLNYVHQPEQKGTADAVRRAKDLLAGSEGHVLILSGDVMLLQAHSIQGLLDTHFDGKMLGTVMTARLDDPTGYGRIVRNSRGEIERICEQADCDSSEKQIQEVNAGIYCFEMEALFSALGKIRDRNEQKEFYLTDVVEILGASGGKVTTSLLSDPIEMTGINDRYALAQAESALQARINRRWMMQGVTIHHPSTVVIDSRTRLAKDVTIEGGSYLIDSIVESGVVVEAGSRILSSVIGEGSHIKQGSYVEDSQVGTACTLGPYAHLRPGSRLEKKVKIGNFVEVKKSILREGAKASHLAYIGDAEVGENSNLGCGFITCNYDGRNKHKTVIEKDVFVGSDSQTVAPVTIGAGSYVASGTTVTEDVPKESLVISRGKQITKKGYAKKYAK